MKKMKDVEMPYNELLKICQSTNIQMTNQQIYHEQKDTIAKSSGQTFLSIGQAGLVPHRKKAAAHSDQALPSQSLIQRIFYPELHKINTKGCASWVPA